MGKCQGCAKEFASPQSLWNHKQRCKGYVHLADHDEVSPTVEKRNVYASYKSNPKVQAFVDGIINSVPKSVYQSVPIVYQCTNSVPKSFKKKMIYLYLQLLMMCFKCSKTPMENHYVHKELNL